MVYDSEAGRATILLAGDCMVTRRFSHFREEAFLKLATNVREADFSLTNAEMLFHNYESPPSYVSGGTYMRADPRVIEDLQWLGMDAVSTANNHALDFGVGGIVSNIRNLDRAGLAHAGTGSCLEEARRPTYVETRAGRVALIAATASGSAECFAGEQWRLGRGRPGANLIRFGTEYVVPPDEYRMLYRLAGSFHRLEPVATGSRDYAWLAAGEWPEHSFYCRDFNSEWQYPVPDGIRVTLGESTARRLHPLQADLEANLRWIREARRMADWVIVSLHDHEQGASVDAPSDVSVRFAHAAIDAGADVFFGHGPHRDRGIEIYNGRPVFYSLGHFFVENDSVEYIPWDGMVRQGVAQWDCTPGDFYDSRSGAEIDGEFQGSAGRESAWRDVIARVRFSDRTLEGVDLIPIDMGYRLPRSQRGRPVIATGSVAEGALQDMFRLSQPFGTKIEIDDNRANVCLY